MARQDRPHIPEAMLPLRPIDLQITLDAGKITAVHPRLDPGEIAADAGTPVIPGVLRGTPAPLAEQANPGLSPNPTRAEINKRVVGSMLSEKIFSDRVRSILRLLFKYRGQAS